MNKTYQSRRSFFKNAAKGVLPILGAIILNQLPTTGYAQNSMIEMGCKTGCQGGCRTLCEEGCSHSCNGNCNDTCTGHCNKSCQGSATTYWK